MAQHFFFFFFRLIGERPRVGAAAGSFVSCHFWGWGRGESVRMYSSERREVLLSGKGAETVQENTYYKKASTTRSKFAQQAGL